jgi:hypothetical protein
MAPHKPMTNEQYTGRSLVLKPTIDYIPSSTMEGESQDQDGPISYGELVRRLYCPMELMPEPSPETSLSFVPWTLLTPQAQLSKEEGEESNGRNDNGCHKEMDGASSTAADQQQSSSFPSVSYLDLRRRQNMAWATDRLQEGNEQFYVNPQRSEALYQQGLELVHDHVDILVAYGKLLVHRNRPSMARTKLERALQFDPQHVGAKEQLGRLQHQSAMLRQPTKKIMQVTRESSVYQDVLMERNLAMESVPQEPKQEEEASDRHTTRKKHKHKHKKRRKRHYSSSDESSSSSSDDESSSSSSSHRKRKRRRRRHDSSSDNNDEDNDNDSLSTDDSRRLRKRKHKRRRKHRKKHSKHNKKRKREKRERGKQEDADPKRGKQEDADPERDKPEDEKAADM